MAVRSIQLGEEREALMSQVVWDGDNDERLNVVLSDGTRIWSGRDTTGKALGQKGVAFELRKEHAVVCLEPENGIPVS